MISTQNNTHSTVQLNQLESSSIIGLAGSGVIGWLAKLGIAVPDSVYAASLIEDNGWIIRSGANEVFIQSAVTSQLPNVLRSKLEQSPQSVCEIPREDATILLSGKGSLSVFAQTCGIDFQKIELKRVIYTRVAGVGCCILPEADQPSHRFRIWFDPSYSDYLWQVLNEIANDLG